MPRRNARRRPDRIVALTTQGAGLPREWRHALVGQQAPADRGDPRRSHPLTPPGPQLPQPGVLSPSHLLPAREGGAILPAPARIRARRRGPGGRTAPPPASQHPGDPCVMSGRGVPTCPRSVGNHLDRYDELLTLSCSHAERLRAITAKARRRNPGDRRPPARRRPRGPLGHPRRPLGRGPAGQEPALLDSGRPSQAPRRGQGRLEGTDRRGRLRWPDLDLRRMRGLLWQSSPLRVGATGGVALAWLADRGRGVLCPRHSSVGASSGRTAACIDG